MKKIIFIFIFIFYSTNLFPKELTALHLEIYKNIRCIVCQGQSIADSNSEFAQTIKLVVQDKIQEGNSKKEIYEFLRNKYGEWIVYEPKFNFNNFFLWFLPYLVLVIGAIIIFLMIKKEKNRKVN